MDRNFYETAAWALILILAFALVYPSFPAEATTYIGMYADEGHSECSLYPAPYQLVHFWVWVQPGEDGMVCAEYEITTPPNVIQAATIVNPAAGYHIGDAIVPPGATVCFASCQTGWVWTHQLACLVTDTGPSIITLDPHDDYGIMRSTNCIDFGDPYETMTKINDMFLNQGCCLANEEASWGAIKSLLK
jgi:hypothetical protein